MTYFQWRQQIESQFAWYIPFSVIAFVCLVNLSYLWYEWKRDAKWQKEREAARELDRVKREETIKTNQAKYFAELSDKWESRLPALSGHRKGQ